MQTIKAIPNNLLFIIAAAQDHENEFSWKELYGKLFMENTNIYNSMTKTLSYYGINSKDKIQLEEVNKIISEFLVEFYIQDNYLVNKETQKEYKLTPKSKIDLILKRLGYTQY